MTAEAGRLDVGNVTVCTVDAVGTWKMMGDPVPVRGLPPRELFANVMPPAGNDARCIGYVLIGDQMATGLWPLLPAQHETGNKLKARAQLQLCSADTVSTVAKHCEWLGMQLARARPPLPRAYTCMGLCGVSASIKSDAC